METEYLKRYNDLQHELEEAKVRLVTLNDNIRRIVGRTSNTRTEKNKLFDSKRSDPTPKSNDGPKTKRRAYESKSVFNRLSGPLSRIKSDEEEDRPRLTSRVIRELPTRQEVLAAQCADSESRARNRRMFGSLLGTLHKFTQEESRLKQKEDKKAQIERKLEEQEIQEKESLKKERELLFLDRKRKQMEIRKLELKMNRIKDFETWEMSINSLKKYIKTKSKPNIYFLPKVMNKKTEKLLKESKESLESSIEKRREILIKELSDIENCLKFNDFDIEEHYESVHIISEITQDKVEQNIPKDKDFKDKVELQTDILSHILVKEDSDAKENLNDPIISSSVVVVKNVHQKQPNRK